MSRKTAKEAKVERTTWFAMLFVFLFTSFDRSVSFPTWIVPLALGIILFISSFYQQFNRHWRVSPFTWIIMVLFFVLAGAAYGFPDFIPVDPMFIALLMTAIHIVIGVVTNES